jgi:O-acetyl-ADP-ribose deacetylase (regulator of RNase III)
LLADCYRNSMRVAAGLEANSVAFPAISTGIYRWPITSAAQIAVATIAETAKETPTIATVRIVLFDQATYDVFETTAQ